MVSSANKLHYILMALNSLGMCKKDYKDPTGFVMISHCLQVTKPKLPDQFLSNSVC